MRPAEVRVASTWLLLSLSPSLARELSSRLEGALWPGGGVREPRWGLLLQPQSLRTSARTPGIQGAAASPEPAPSVPAGAGEPYSFLCRLQFRGAMCHTRLKNRPGPEMEPPADALSGPRRPDTVRLPVGTLTLLLDQERNISASRSRRQADAGPPGMMSCVYNIDRKTNPFLAASLTVESARSPHPGGLLHRPKTCLCGERVSALSCLRKCVCVCL